MSKQPSNFDFVGRMGVFGFVSAGLVVLSLLAVAVLGINFGIDFAGGYEIQVKFPKAVEENEIRDALKDIAKDVRVQRFGSEAEHEYLLMVREHGTVNDSQRAVLKERFETLAGGSEKLLSWSLAESGERLTANFSEPITEDQVRGILTNEGLTVKTIVRGDREDRPEYAVELVSLASSIENVLREKLSIGQEVELVDRVEFVGPQVGEQLRNQGLLAVLYALGFILLYVGLRFDLLFSPGAVIALIHDIIITIGVFSVFQFEFNLPIVAAILALVGYSLNDTIVVYDRIRENVGKHKGRDLRTLINASINETLSRTILTSGTTLLVVTALLIFGGGIIRDFSIAMLVGIVVGTYSSIFVAAPLYVFLREYFDTKEANVKKTTAVKAVG